MIKFTGRSKFKVYMPLKPIKFGFKVYALVPSEAPIILNLSFYDGSTRCIQDIVSELITPFEGKGHILYMDRFYTSPKIFKTLQTMGVGAVGTCMHNRLQLNDDLKDNIASLNKGEFIYYESNELLLTVWKDSKTVYLLSTVDQVKNMRLTRRKRKKYITEADPSITENIIIPAAINKYNRLARGVDILRHTYFSVDFCRFLSTFVDFCRFLRIFYRIKNSH